MDFLPSFIVGLCSIFVSAIIFIVQRHTQIKYGLKEKQESMKEKQKLINVLYKTKDVKDPEVMKEINHMQKEMMDLSMETMKSSFKNMFWIMLLSLLIFAYVARFTNSQFPVGAVFGISPVFVWYIIVSLLSNILYKIIFNILEKNKIISDKY